MAQVITDKRDVEFVLHEQLEVEKLAKHERFAEFTKKTVDLILSEARNLAVKEMLPVLRIADEEGCKLENGTVRVPESFHRIYELFNKRGIRPVLLVADSAEIIFPVAVEPPNTLVIPKSSFS